MAPSLKPLRPGTTEPHVWYCGCGDSHLFLLAMDGTVICDKCRQPVLQLEVHITPQIKKRQ